MVYTTYLLWFGWWFTIVLLTLVNSRECTCFQYHSGTCHVVDAWPVSRRLSAGLLHEIWFEPCVTKELTVKLATMTLHATNCQDKHKFLSAWRIQVLHSLSWHQFRQIHASLVITQSSGHMLPWLHGTTACEVWHPKIFRPLNLNRYA